MRPLLVYSMSPSVDGFINDRDGGFEWGAPTDRAPTWSALPKVVFSRALESVEGNARLARASLPDGPAAALERVVYERYRRAGVDPDG